jgi:hypothetical protein
MMMKIRSWRRPSERLCVCGRSTRSPGTHPSPPLNAPRCPSRRPDPRLSPLRAKMTPLRWRDCFTSNLSGSSSWLPCGRCENGPCMHTCDLFSPASNRPVNSALRIKRAGYRMKPCARGEQYCVASRPRRPPYYRVGLRTKNEQNRAAKRRPPCYRIELCAMGEQYCLADYVHPKAQAILLPHGALCEGRAVLRIRPNTQATLLPRRTSYEGRAKPRSRTQATLLPHRAVCEGRAILRGRLSPSQGVGHPAATWSPVRGASSTASSADHAGHPTTA